MKYLGLIPARGGSKRIPGKNVKPLGGVPLIGYTIRAAQGSCLDEFIVSTEDDKIEAVAHSYGAAVLKRPDELAEDDASTGRVAVHAADAMELKDEDAIVILHPTSPFRDEHDIDAAIRMFDSTYPKHDALASVASLPIKQHANVKTPLSWVRGGYIMNGAIYILNVGHLRKTRAHTHGVCLRYLMGQRNSLDIDTPLDWLTAEAWLRADSQ
jgi:CMP-N-acetylneuraminic acid synthetase